MERLTETMYGEGYCAGKSGCEDDCTECTHYRKMLDKLAHYEDLEEQGLLLKLPCKVGDVFWELNNANAIPHIYPRYAHTLAHCVYVLERLGRITFLTKEEAEAKLRKVSRYGKIIGSIGDDSRFL